MLRLSLSKFMQSDTATLLVTIALVQNGFAHDGGVAGSWDASIDAFGSTSRAMYSFHQGGTLTEADNPGFDPGFNGDALSPGLGAWALVTLRSVEARYQKFAYNIGGELTSIYVSTIKATLDSDNTMSGTIGIVISAADGTVITEIPDLPFTANRIRARSGSECVDTDGDGWGWDGVDSCRP